MAKRLPVVEHIKASTPEKRRRIEAAALALFTRQGFHGTNNREIARQAGVSTAAIYSYYPSKEALFQGLIERHRRQIGVWLRNIAAELTEPLSKPDLIRFAAAIRAKQGEDPEYFRLIFIDVVEFKGRYSQASFHDLPRWFRHILGDKFDTVEQNPAWSGLDPAFVLAVVYMYFVHYSLIECHMGVHEHLGVPADVATERIVEIVTDGLWRGPEAAAGRSRKAASPIERKLFDEAAEDRIDFIRLLSCRLWRTPPEIPDGRVRRQSGRPAAKTPLLVLPEIARQQPDETQLRIEAAALELFTTQGFHGTNIRDIADKAGISQGTIYTYYASKEILFEQLVAIYRGCIMAFSRKVVAMLEDPFSPDGLRLVAKAIRSLVYDDAEYWLLMFIDVLEFDNRHFQDMYREFAGLVSRAHHPPVWDKIRQLPGWCGLDPAFVFSAIYFMFFGHFVTERHMHGDRHLGMSAEDAIERMIDLVSNGCWRPASDELGDASRARRPAAHPSRPRA
jgi:AcrR family transcriptional regulator